MYALVVWHTNLHETFSDFVRLVWISLDASLGVRAEHDEREGQLSAVFVRDGDNADIRDIRVVEQVALELRRRNLERAHFDELLDPVDEEDLSALVELGFVACPEPAVVRDETVDSIKVRSLGGSRHTRQRTSLPFCRISLR